jgi:hypothetical protein
MHETTQITYGEGTITVTMSSDSLTEVTAPDVRFGDYNAALTACFSEKELVEISEGEDAYVTFDFVMRDELEDPNEEQAFDKAIAGAEKTYGTLHKGVFFDVFASASVGSDQPRDLDRLSSEVELQFGIPLYLVAEDRYYYVMTEENGVINLEEDVDEEADTLSVNTGDIGASLILYQTEKETLVRKDTTLHIHSNHVFVGGIVVLAIVWLLLDFHHRRNRM